MIKYVILGLMIFGLISCASAPTVDSNVTKNEDTNRTKKVIVVDLDKEIAKDDYSKGGLRGEEDKVIPIFIGKDIGDNDEVAFSGDILKKNSPVKIKIGDNDEVAFSGYEYIIRTVELKDGDIVTIKYGEEKEIRMKVRDH